MALLGVPLVDALYDARYAAAGPVVVLIACAQIPNVIGMTYDQAALAAGDSRRFCYVLAAKAALFSVLFLVGAEVGGLVGALARPGPGAVLLAYPLVVWLARRYGQWDPVHDLAYAATGLACGAVAIWLNWDAIAAARGRERAALRRAARSARARRRSRRARSARPRCRSARRPGSASGRRTAARSGGCPRPW